MAEIQFFICNIWLDMREDVGNGGNWNRVINCDDR